MSEIIANIEVDMPTGYEKLDGLEVIKRKDGNASINGLLKLGDTDAEFNRRIQSLDPLEMWGYDIGTSDWERRKADPAGWERERTFNQLVERVSALESLVAIRDNRIEDLEVQVRSLTVGSVEPEDSTQTTVPEAITEGDTESTENLNAQQDQQTPLVDEVLSGEPNPNEAELQARIRDLENINNQQLVELARTEGQLSEADRHTEYYRQTQEVVWYRRPRVFLAAGAVAVSAALLGLAAYTYHEVEEIEHRQANPDYIQNSDDENQYYETDGSVGSGMHVDFYSSVPSQRLTGVVLPKILKTKHNLDGSISLIDSSGKVIIKKLAWDQQGNLTKNIRSQLKDLKNGGYVVNQGKLGNRYATVVHG